MKNIKTYLFVYGTLRRGLASSVSHLIADDIEWNGDAVINGELYEIGDYPGAVPSKDAKSLIRGEVIEILAPGRVWKILDKYEGCDKISEAETEYTREKTLAQLSDKTRVEAWVYWYNLPVKDKRRIRSNDYLKYLRKKQLA